MFALASPLLHLIATLIGAIGVFLCLLAYFLLQCGKISPSGFGFSLYNLFGAAMILFSLFYDWNLAAALIEGAWVLISLFGVIRVFIRRKKHSSPQ